MRTGGRSAQRVCAQPAQRISASRPSATSRTGLFSELAEELVHEAAHDLVLELAVDREGLLGDLVGHRRERLRELDRGHRVVVEDRDAGRVPERDELQATVLGDVELDQQLALDAPLARQARIRPLRLDALPDLVEVVLILRLRRIEGNRLALHAATTTPAP